MKTLLMILALSATASAAEWTFTTPRDGEVGLTIHAVAAGSNWGRAGAEAVILTLSLDGSYNQDVTLFLGETQHDYKILLGPLKRGAHRLDYQRNERFSAAGARTFEASFRAEVLDDPALAYAPMLYLRPNTVGKFSDIPLLAWYEWLYEPEGRVLQFSVIFTNEDGGTATDALIARWGRTLDIEHLYRWTPRGGIYQGSNHKEKPFNGRKIGEHPLLYDVTDNNNFEDTGDSPLRIALWPVPANLSHHSREQLADEAPWTYRLMAEELAREGKMDNVGDPRDYLYVEARLTAANAAASFAANGQPFDLGRAALRITRDGWIRTAMRLPEKKLSSLEFRCHPPERPRLGPTCSIEEISKAFFLDQDYRPGPNLLEWHGPTVQLKTGERKFFLGGL